MNTRAPALLAAAGFLACILAANYVTAVWGFVPVGFGLTATAGTYFAGLSFVLRDSLQDAVRQMLPRRVVLVETFHEVPVGGRVHMISTGHRRELAPPRDRDVALRVLVVVLLGAGLSLALSPLFTDAGHLPPGVTATSIALASGVAFLCSETADFAVYTPLRRGGYVRAAVASNLVGTLLDTYVFLTISGFGLMGWQGQVVGKLAVTGVVVLLVAAYRLRRRVGVVE